MASNSTGIRKVKSIFNKNNDIRKRMLRMKLYGNSIFPNGSTYLDYVNATYGTEDASITFINNLLVGMKPEAAIRSSKVGTIDYPRVLEALNGNITTNPNYSEYSKIVNLGSLFNKDIDYNEFIEELKDADTKLGAISNAMYSSMLYHAANINSARGRGQSDSGFSYITPSLYGYYGNNLLNVARLGEEFYIDKTTERIRNTNEDTKVGVIQIGDILYDGKIKEGIDYGQSQYLIDQLSRQRNLWLDYGVSYYTYTPYYHVQGSKKPGYVGTIGSGWSDIPTQPVSTNNLGSSKNDLSNERGVEYIYNENDSPREYTTDGINDYEPEDTYDIDNSSQFNQYHSFNTDTGRRVLGKNNLLQKTNRMFNEHKIKTMVGRFFSKGGGSNPGYDNAYNDIYGNSHGRNLLKRGANTDGFAGTEEYGYKNPYCRTWTYHHQYDRYSRAIRPFVRENQDENGETVYEPYTIKEVQNTLSEFRASIRKYRGVEDISDGGDFLDNYTVLGNNGFVKIGPYEEDVKEKGGLHNYMLSIENLAWKKYPHDIEKMRRGPNGGRIMWFPPYDLQFNESTNVEWNPNTFIGRGEKVYTYSNTERQATLSFVVLVDHPSLLDTKKYRGFDGYDGSDAVSDTLRYFAGCETFMNIEENKSGNNNNQRENAVIDDPIEQTIEDDYIKFAVFFPNNYSGNMTSPFEVSSGATNTSKTSRSNKIRYEQEGLSGFDNDWVEYLLSGRNCIINSSSKRGYEMSSSESTGVSVSGAASSELIPACETGPFGNYIPCKKSTNKNFYYRVDFDLRQNALRDENYMDSKSYGLNCRHGAIEDHCQGNLSGTTCSFAEFILGLVDGDSSYSGLYSYATSNGASSTRINTITDKFKNSFVKSISVRGGATKQDKGNSATLAERRSNSTAYRIREMIEYYYPKSFPPKKLDDASGLEITKEPNIEWDNNAGNTINSEIAKYERCAVVTVWFASSKVSTNGSDVDEESMKKANQVVQKDVQKDIKTEVESDMGYYEYEYFKELSVNDPVLFKSIKDRYRNFDPAFHSMSPEGFNARMNFLQQCTRQGHTLSASEVNGSTTTAPTAGNLSFGMMPVCVLRIGDFINSRMVITSLNIDYSRDGMQWDLNPEGVGVQPMFARVTLSIVLIGGSSLNMPVNRLQNAQTFDYYANTGVYDPRADRVEMVDGKPVYKYLFVPSSGTT